MMSFKRKKLLVLFCGGFFVFALFEFSCLPVHLLLFVFCYLGFWGVCFAFVLFWNIRPHIAQAAFHHNITCG